MDLAFGGLIEKLEDHFGRGVTKLILASLALLVLLWVVQSSISAVVTIEDLVTRENAAEAVMGYVLRLAVTFLFGLVVGLWITKIADKRLQRIKDAVHEYESLAEEVYRTLLKAVDQTKQAEDQRDRSEALLKSAREQIDKALALTETADREKRSGD